MRAHLGNCLERRQDKDRGGVAAVGERLSPPNPKHDYGYTLMTLAEAQAAGGESDRALATWRQVLSLYSYARARVQFAELLIARKEYAEARKNLDEVIEEIPFSPKFQRNREAVWLRRAKALRRTLPA